MTNRYKKRPSLEFSETRNFNLETQNTKELPNFQTILSDAMSSTMRRNLHTSQ